MGKERSGQVEELLNTALQLQPSEWPAFLARIADPAVRAEVESLLKSSASNDSIARAVPEPAGVALPNAGEAPIAETEFVKGQISAHAMIGPYRLLQ